VIRPLFVMNDLAALPAAEAAGYVTKPPAEAEEPTQRVGFVA